MFSFLRLLLSKRPTGVRLWTMCHICLHSAYHLTLVEPIRLQWRPVGTVHLQLVVKNLAVSLAPCLLLIGEQLWFRSVISPCSKVRPASIGSSIWSTHICDVTWCGSDQMNMKRSWSHRSILSSSHWHQSSCQLYMCVVILSGLCFILNCQEHILSSNPGYKHQSQ